MRKQAPFMAVILTLAVSMNAYAGFHIPAAWRYRCVSLLKTILPVSPRDLTEEEIKLDYNRQSLSGGQARMVSPKQDHIRLAPLGGTRFELLDNITRKSIDWLLDQSLPFWRQDGEWYFQTARAIYLYSPNSETPIRFEPETYILMSGQFARGQITMGPHPWIDLFD